MYDRIQARLQKLGGDPNDLHRRDLVNKLGLVDKALAKPETTNPKNLELHARSLYSLSNGKLTLDPDHDVKWQQEFKTICSLAGSLLYKAADYVRAVRKGGLK